MKRLFLGTIVLATLIVAVLAAGMSGPPGSNRPSKAMQAQNSIDFWQSVANDKSQNYLNLPQLENKTLVSAMGLSGPKFNDKGEALDPWGYPYVISKENNQITVRSVGLEKYEKMSAFSKWWNE